MNKGWISAQLQHTPNTWNIENKEFIHGCAFIVLLTIYKLFPFVEFGLINSIHTFLHRLLENFQ